MRMSFLASLEGAEQTMKKEITIENLQKCQSLLKELGFVNDRERTEEEIIYGKPRTASKIRLLKRYYADLKREKQPR